MSRRIKGEGSVYTRNDGRVMGEYLDMSGKKRYVSGKNKTDVKAKLRKAIEDREAGIIAGARSVKLAEYLDNWLVAIRDTVRPSTLRPYEAIVRLHLKPALGNVKLDQLTPLQLQALYREKLDSGLSPRRVQYIHVTIRKALKDAVRWQMLARNVADAATPPRPGRREMHVLDRGQIRILLRAAKRRQPQLYALYALACTTGMRQGELLGLQPGDVDLDAGTARVSRSVYGGTASAPKTASSRRTIRLSKVALEALAVHLEQYAGEVWIFATSADTPISCHNLHNRSWKPLLRAAGLPHETRFHDLRHSAASLLIASGVPVPVVSNLLGHADPSITLKVYAHLLPDQQGAAALAMNGILEEAEPESAPILDS